MSSGVFEDVLPEVFPELRGIAESTRTSNSLRDFLMVCLNSMSSVSISYVHPQLSSNVELLLCGPIQFFFLLRVARPIRPNFWPFSFGPGCCLNVRLSLSGPRTSLARGFTQC